jgi:hypothetical protein
MVSTSSVAAWIISKIAKPPSFLLTQVARHRPVHHSADDKLTNQTTLVSQATASGYNVEHWSGDGQDYWVISDLTREELTDFAGAWQEK